MSADRKRLTSALRRIVKTDPDVRSLLTAAESKGGKPGAAGVGSSTEAQQARICCDGSTSGSANPGTEERNPDSSTQSGLDSTDPADLTSGDGTLSGVTDCATGEPICFDGAGFIPPDGWDGPSDPPTEDGYEEGFYWTRSAACPASTPCRTYKCVLDGGCFTMTECSYNSTDGLVYYTVYDSCQDRYVDGADGITKNSCGTSTESYCTEVPYEDAWPSDSCVNLAVKGGTIVGSKYDPENDGSYSAPRDSIDLCSGTDQISLAPAANGGWKTINSTTNNGYLYDSSGNQIAHIDGNEYSDPSV